MTDPVDASAVGARVAKRFGHRGVEPLGLALAVGALLSALGLLAAVLVAHVVDGGRYLDDWWLSAYVHFPHQLGFSGSFDYLNFYGGGRLGATAYWWLTYNLFLADPAWQRALGVIIGAALTVVFYLLLRELRIGRLEAAAIAILSLALPVADSIHFWITPQVGQLCIAACAGGFLVALRGLNAGDARPRLVSLGLYALSLLIAETTLPAIALSVLIYRTRAPWRQARKWWAQDLVLVAVAAIHYAASAPLRRASSGGVGTSLHHAGVIANQAITLFTGTLVPFDHGRGWVVLGLIAVGALSVLYRRRAASGTRLSPTTVFWLRTGAIAAIFALASYVVYVPADPSYQPLVPAIGNRVNIGALLPLSVVVFAVVRVLGQLFVARSAVLIVSAALYSMVLAQALVQLDADRWLWDQAASHQAAVLEGLHRALPDPPPGVSLLVVNSPGVVTRFQRVGDRYVNVSAPVFSTWWELDAAVKLSYGRADINAYPIWSQQPPQVACGKHDVYQLGLDHVRHVLPYGEVYLVDPEQSAAIPLEGQAACNKEIGARTTVRFDLPV